MKVEAKKRIEQREKEDKPANFNLKLVAELKVSFIYPINLLSIKIQSQDIDFEQELTR